MAGAETEDQKMITNFRVNTFTMAEWTNSNGEVLSYERMVATRYFETETAASAYIAGQPSEIRAELYDQRPAISEFKRGVEAEKSQRAEYERTGPHWRPAPMTGADWDDAWNNGPGGEA
jgi:hypothetical protein